MPDILRFVHLDELPSEDRNDAEMVLLHGEEVVDLDSIRHHFAKRVEAFGHVRRIAEAMELRSESRERARRRDALSGSLCAACVRLDQIRDRDRSAWLEARASAVQRLLELLEND